MLDTKRFWVLAFVVAAWGPIGCTDPLDSSDPEKPGIQEQSAPKHDMRQLPDLTAKSPDLGTVTSPDVTIIVEPSDSGAALIAALKGAKKSVHMTMYLLTDSDIQDALIARHKAGVDVKVILNQNFPFGSATNNKDSQLALATAGVPVVWSSSTYPFTHEKSVVLDGKTAWIMTMNAATSSLTSNREYLAIDTTPGDVAETEAQFAADFAGIAYVPAGDLLMSPVTSRPGITGLIDSAKTTLDFQDEVIGDPLVTMALCNARARGVHVRGVLSSGTESTNEKTAVAQLKACGATMVSLSTPYIHAKAIVVDAKRIYIGSENFTSESLDHNRELGLITETAAAVAAVAHAVAADISAGKAL